MKKKYINTLLIIISYIILLKTNNLIIILLPIIVISKEYLNDKNLKKYLTYLFIIYVAGLSYLTFFSSFYKRSFIGLEWNFDVFCQYVKSCNIIPLKTIYFYLKCFFTFSEQITQVDIFRNLIGNFICLIPLAIFVPFFSKKNRQYKKFSLFIFLTSLSIELIQFITMTGAFDIDDVLLNSSGCIIFYFIFSEEIISYYDKKSLSKQKAIIFIKKVILVTTMCLLIILSFTIRDYKEKQYWKKYHFEQIKVINYDLVCKYNENNLIYEDELYEYYIKCDSPEKIKISIDGNTIFLEEYLQKKTMYPVIMHKLEDSGINLEKVEKNKKIIICPNDSVAIKYKVSDYNIVELNLGDYVEENGKLCSVFFIIPRKEGTTTAVFETSNKKEKYKIIVSTKKEGKYDIKLENVTT